MTGISARGSAPAEAARAATVEAVPWDDPDAEALRSSQQAELAHLYGQGDLEAFIAPEIVAAMLLVRVDGVAAACGALRGRGPRVGELKRMFVLPRYRGRGLSRLVLNELERRATALGWERLILETGVLQPEAIGLYLSAGYTLIPNYPPYEDEVLSRCFTKTLRTAGGSVEPARPTQTADGRVEPARPTRTAAAATADDVAIAAVPFADPLATELRREMYLGLAPRYPEFTAQIERTGGFAAMDERLGRDVVVTLVAWRDGEAVGTASLQPVSDPTFPSGSRTGEVKKVYVRPEARGSGVARRLMTSVEDVARENGWTQLALQTGSRQAEAIALYVTHGYRPVVPYGPHLGDALALCFVKRLG